MWPSAAGPGEAAGAEDNKQNQDIWGPPSKALAPSQPGTARSCPQAHAQGSLSAAGGPWATKGSTT